MGPRGCGPKGEAACRYSRVGLVLPPRSQGLRLTSLALSCVSNMVGRGRELQGEWRRSLYADHVSFSA